MTRKHWLRISFGRHPLAAWLVLLLSLMVTSWAWYVSDRAVSKNANERFSFEAEDVATAITRRMKEYELVLRSGSALFDADEEVTREDWTAFADTIYLQKYFPGIQALGYSVMLSAKDVDAHVERIRAQGYTDYNIKPEDPREQYSAIIYIEPFDWRNRRAFGYDMFSESTRREAMQRARDTGQPATSGRVTLVQETDEDVQYGFLMYYPIYHKNRSLEYVQERRDALKSYVYAAFRMGDLMHGILGQAQDEIAFEIYDSSQVDASTMLYKSEDSNDSGVDELSLSDNFSKSFQLDIAGRTWTLFVYAHSGFIPFAEKNQPRFIILVGILLDIFLFYLISYLVKGRNLARKTALEAESDRELTEQRMQLAAEAGGMGLGEWNITQNRLYWDSRMLELHGYTKETFTGDVKDWQQRVHPEDFQKVRKLLSHAKKFSSRMEVEYRVLLPDNRIRYIATSAIVERDQADKAIRMVGFNRDVTEQRKADEALNEKNWRLQNVLEGTNVGTWEWNVQTGKTVFNERWAEIIGYQLSELEPVSIETWLQFAHPDDLKRSNEALQRHFDGKAEYYRCESRMRHRDGHWVWVLDRGKVFSWDKSGKPLLMFGTHQDITEQKNYESLLRKERDKAKLANQARGEFLANMSHEIRTPINGVIGALNLLSDTHLNTSQQNLLGISKQSAEALLGLINDILDLSKMESGKLKIIEEKVELLGLIHDVSRGLATRAEAKGLSLLCPDHYMQEYTVIADGLRLRQVLTNLISNAIKFTDKGQVTLDVEILEQTRSRSRLRFNVRDTGPGISAERQERLFQRFQQLDNSMTRREGGTGLGLAICKQLAELMGGTIGVESEVGKGARFWVEITFDRVHERRNKSKHLFENLQVWVVNATPLYQQFYESVLTAWRVDFELARDCKTALASLAQSNAGHKVVLLEAETMLDNPQCLTYLDTNRSNLASAKMIVTCPQSMLAVIPQLISDEADLIVSKPLNQSDLYNALLAVVQDSPDTSAERVKRLAAYKQFDARVLVVEDNPTNITVVRGLLEKFGIEVSVAENGAEALEMLSESYFDLVLMDCQMPVMDGYETTRQIREDEKVLDANVPVLALTAHAMRDDEQKCLDAGMNDYLSKPVDPYLLNQKLAQWLPEHCQQEAAS